MAYAARFDFFITRRSVELISVCQPGPWLRKWLSTSASSRRVVETFGCSDFGRPRFTGAASNFAFHFGEDRSGASSGSTKAGAVVRLFFAIGFPHRNDAAGRAARCPDQNDHPAGETPDRDLAD